MKHCLLVHQAFVARDEVGGTRHVEFMERLAPRWRFTVVAGAFAYITGQRATGSEDVPANVRVVRAWVPPGLTRYTILRIVGFLCFMATSFAKALAARDVDVVLGTVPSTFQGFTALFVARLKRVPFVLEVRDLWPDFAIAAGVLENRIVYRIGRWLEGVLYRSADRVIVNSPGFVEHVAERGVPRDRIELIVNGVSPDELANGDRYLYRERWGLQDRFVALYAGSHGPAMDLDLLLDAAERITERHGITIVLIGDGREKERLVASAAARGLDHVRFEAPVAKREMRHVLAAADVGIAILRDRPEFRTTYPNKVFDYMAAGLPTILAIDGPIRAVIEAADAGTFVPPGDPEALAKTIEAYRADPERRRTEGAAASRAVRDRFDRAQQAERFEALLEMITVSSRRG